MDGCKRMKQCIAFLVVLFCASNLVAQNKRLSRAAIDSLRRIHTMDIVNGELCFNRCRYDMGTLYDTDSARTVSFKFCNTADEAVNITHVKTSCGCVTVNYNKEIIASGDSGVVNLVFNPKGKSGTIDTDAFIYTNLSPGKPTARLVLLGNVIAVDEWDYLPVKMGNLRLKTDNVLFSMIPGKPSVERIVCANTGVKPVEVKACILPEYVKFRCEPSVLHPGEEGDIVITIDGNEKLLPVLNDSLQFKILLEGIDCRPSQRTINCLMTLTDKH